MQQLIYWSDKGKRGDGYFYKTAQEMEDETTIPQRTQFNIRKRLEKKGLITTKRLKANGAPTIHFKVNRLELADLLNANVQSCQMETTLSAESITESTTETTTKSISKSQDEPSVSSRCVSLKDLSSWTGDVINLYLDAYEQFLGKKHPNLKGSQIQRITDTLKECSDGDRIFCGEDLGMDTWSTMIDKWFTKDGTHLGKDWNINLWAQPGVLVNLYYKYCY